MIPPMNPTPTHLFFIRHAQTDLAGTFCGHSDPPLNAAGEAQLPGLLTRLTPFQISAIYSSDLRRAQQTAACLAQARNLPVYPTPALREISFGDWETLTWDQIEQRDPTYAARWVTEFPALPTPSGEPIHTFRQRILTEIHRLRSQAATENLAIVTHAGVLRVLLESIAHFAPHHAWERTRDYTCILHCTQTSPDSLLEVHP